MNKTLGRLFALVAASALLTLAQSTRPKMFRGQVADSQCSMNIHSLTRSHAEMLKSKSMGGNAASCTLYCVRYMGGEFVLASKSHVYYLDIPSARDFAGQNVKVTGALNAKTKTIRATNIEFDK